MDHLDKWRNALPVRYRCGREFAESQIPPGSQGVVLEFFSPRGEAYWQVRFAELGTQNVHRDALEVLDADFDREAATDENNELQALVDTTKEAVVYSTRKKQFKSLVIWSRNGQSQTFDSQPEADKLFRLLKQQGIPISSEVWFS